MTVKPLPLDHQYVLNFVARTVARENSAARHNYGQYSNAADPRARLCEPWRFPLVDTHRDTAMPDSATAFNRVTFVYAGRDSEHPGNVGVIGTFATLNEPTWLERVTFLGEATPYHALSVAVPKGEVHRYRFLVEGEALLDPINPQIVTTPDGAQWSRFYTHQCTTPIVLSRREMLLVGRLSDHILPFRTPEGERFLRVFYNQADRQSKETQLGAAFRLDQSVGVANFIDKLLAREEAHHLVDYRICLDLTATILRRRHPAIDLAVVPKETFADLYQQMASGNVPGWDYDRYNDPAYFLKLLRRHTYTGAFSHPRHGGNVGAAGWAYLEETYRAPDGSSCFDWRKALEGPLGLNPDYRG
jgi:hypothetical protein